MFRALFKLKTRPALSAETVVGEASMPDKTTVRSRAWCVLIADGRVGYIDHYKTDGRFGVRPVDARGRHYPNPSRHWTNAQRLATPEELSLSLRELRAADDDDIPPMYRRNAMH
jgi:hypothetical protein